MVVTKRTGNRDSPPGVPVQGKVVTYTSEVLNYSFTTLVRGHLEL